MRSAKTLVALADTLAATLLLVATESVFVGLWRRRDFVDGFELKLGTLHTTIVAFALAAPIAVLGLGLRAIVARGDTALGRRTLAGLAAASLGVLAFLVTTGRHFASLLVRAPFVLLLAVAAGSVAWVLSPKAAEALRARPVQVGVAAAALAVLLVLANGLILPRLYPPFHGALALATVLSAPFLALAVHHEGRETSPFMMGYAILAGLSPLVDAALLLPRSVAALTPADNVRYAYGEHAPTVGYAVRFVASRMTEGTPEVDLSPAPDETSSFSLEGRDIVLLSVDALRADHVGAYGYERETTPHLDALAREGVRFEHAYAATPHTSYSVTSMMTGKYLRPLLLQGATREHDTWAKLLRVYGYRTAAFYPPAVFFIDPERFSAFRESGLDFEYRRVEFLPAERRAEQVASYLDRVKPQRRVFLWVHLFEPHEPYERHETAPFGDRDLDRYDGEIRAADEGIGRIVAEVRRRRPNAVFIVTADHGEEFGEHGGRFHGTTVYEEQIRVPLVIAAKGLLAPRVVTQPVQTIDLLPTVLASLGVPRPARIRGRNIGPLAAGKGPPGGGFAFSETEDFTMVAEDELRLVCQRRVNACQLYDIVKDPDEQRDASPGNGERLAVLRRHLRATEAQHGRLEMSGLRAEGRGYPEAIRRGIAGDGDAASDVASLLEDADVSFRRKAAEVLFELARKETAAALRLALTRDEDEQVRRWCALALTRLGEGAGKTLELVEDKDLSWRRLASLALAEAGDARGADVLAGWFAADGVPFERARQIVTALGKIRAKSALGSLSKCLADVRLRALCIDALVAIGDASARPVLLEAFATERRLPLRSALGQGLLTLGAGAEMAPAVARFMGTPDPLPDGLALAIKGRFLSSVGGPDEKEIVGLGRPGSRVLHLLVPRGGNGKGARLVVRGRSRGETSVVVRIGKPPSDGGGREAEHLPGTSIGVPLPPSPTSQEAAFDAPASWGVIAGQVVAIALTVPDNAILDGVAVIPLADELPPPPKEAWTPSPTETTADVVDE